MNVWNKEPQHGLLPPSARSKAMEDALEQWFRIFQGQPDWLSHKRPRTLKLAAASTQYLARLVCAELQLQAEGGERAQLLQEALEQSLLPQLPSAVQLAMVGGAVALKPYVKEGRLALECLGAQHFSPVLSKDGREQMAFFSYCSLEKQQYLRVELHSFEEGLYHISNRAYLCDSSGKARKQVSLEHIPPWKDVQEDLYIQGLNAPLYAIWRMPFSNSVDGSEQPVSLYASAVQVLEDIDRLYNDYCYEFASARRKMILREDALRMKRDGSPILPHSDGADDVFLPLDMPGETAAFGDYTPDIRESAYRQALAQLLRLYEMLCGVSAGSFSMEENGALTATEVIAKDRKTYYTVQEIQQQGRAALSQLCEAMDALASLCDLGKQSHWKLNISFGDSVFEDSDKEFQRRLKLVELGMKPELLLAWYFDRSEEAARDMMKKEENSNE